MAIKLKKSSNDGVPPALDELATKGFTNSVLAKHFDENAGVIRKEVMAYLSHNADGFDLVEKTIQCSNGALTFVERSNYSFDVDAIEKLIESGVVTLTTILQTVTFRATDLKTALGSKFEDVATKSESQTLSFKPNAEFKSDVLLKAEVINHLGGEKMADPQVNESQPAKKTAKKATEEEISEEDISDSIAKAKAAASPPKTKKSVSKKESVEAELDDLLGK